MGLKIIKTFSMSELTDLLAQNDLSLSLVINDGQSIDRKKLRHDIATQLDRIEIIYTLLQNNFNFADDNGQNYLALFKQALEFLRAEFDKIKQIY